MVGVFVVREGTILQEKVMEIYACWGYLSRAFQAREQWQSLEISKQKKIDFIWKTFLCSAESRGYSEWKQGAFEVAIVSR